MSRYYSRLVAVLLAVRRIIAPGFRGRKILEVLIIIIAARIISCKEKLKDFSGNLEDIHSSIIIKVREDFCNNYLINPPPPVITGWEIIVQSIKENN